MLEGRQLFSKGQVAFFNSYRIPVCCAGLIGVQYFLVVLLNDSFHIVHTSTANFNGVLLQILWNL